MSISALCNHDEIAVQTLTATTGASMGVQYTVSSSTTKRCLVQELSGIEIQSYAARGLEVSHELFFSSNPSIGRNHRIVYEGDYLEVKGVFKEGRPGGDLLWIVAANHQTTRDR